MRRAAPRGEDSRYWLWLPGIVIFLSGLIAQPLVGVPDGRPAPYAAAALFGLLVGATELIARYKDKPTAPLTTTPGVIYVTVNATAALGALWLLREKGVNVEFGGTVPVELGQVLLAGFATMAFFRTSLFTLRVGESDVAIGPAAVLQVILNASDRACDRLRAGPRSEQVIQIMRGVSFELAKNALPVHCLALMQNVSAVEQTQLIQAIQAIENKSMRDEIKAYNLGLVMMNVVGEDVLKKAVQALGPLILAPASDEPPVLERAAALSFDDALALIDLCVALDPLLRSELSADALRALLIDAVKNVQNGADRNVVVLTRLRERFGASTLFRALALLAAGRRTETPTSAPLTPDDLTPRKRPPAPGGI